MLGNLLGYVGINIPGDGYRCVPELIRHHFERHTSLKHPCGIGMPCVMQSDRRQTSPFQDRLKGTIHAIGIDRTAICLCEDESMVLVRRTESEPFFCLPCSVLA